MIAAGPDGFRLVLSGCGAAVPMAGQTGILGISPAFGVAVLAAACGQGDLGAHLNLAVSRGMLAEGG